MVSTQTSLPTKYVLQNSDSVRSIEAFARKRGHKDTNVLRIVLRYEQTLILRMPQLV
jgi:hypothetical protein